MVKIRCRFSKKGDLIFISHLDLVRLFERAMRRSNLPISYSQGFNPHPVMAFATALGVGISSEAEYIDLQLEDRIAPAEFIERLNAVMPGGLTIMKAEYIEPGTESLMAILRRSLYLVTVQLTSEQEQESLEEKLRDFLRLETIIEIKEKKKKKGKQRRREQNLLQEINIREWIHGVELFSLIGKELIIKANLATGSAGNLKPEVLMNKIQEICDLPLDLETVRINRLELLKEGEGQFVPLMD